MASLKSALVVFCLGLSYVIADQHSVHDVQLVDVAVYYESLCPDSMKFFTQQLYPSLQGNLSKYVNLTLVPYGKTTTKFVNSDYEFECQHGPDECFGNKIQGCSLHLIDQGKPTPGYGFNRVTVGFINCLMDKTVRNGSSANFPVAKCAEINDVAVLGQIQNCANHTDASNYMAIYGKLTDEVQKPLTYVPTIVFNSKYNEDDTNMSQTNFVKALCQYIQGDKPTDCNSAGKLGSSIVFLLVISYISRFFV